MLRARKLFRPQVHYFLYWKNKVIFNDYSYNGIKYITSEDGFKQFEGNFIKEITNNFKIRETRNIDNTLCELITSELDIEKVVEKYQHSLVTLFWDVMQHILIVVYQQPLKMGLIGCPKKSVYIYLCMLYKFTEEQRLHIMHNIFIPLANVIIIK